MDRVRSFRGPAHAFHVYSHYSNRAAAFGVAFQYARANVLKSAGIQVQGEDYRPYVSWDWKSVNGKVAKTSSADVEHEDGHRVEKRRHDLRVLAEIAGQNFAHRNYDHRWRGYGRHYGDLSPEQLLQTVYAEALLVRAAVQ